MPPVLTQGVPLELLYVAMELQVSVPLELVGVPLELKCVPPGTVGSTGAEGYAPGAERRAPRADGCAYWSCRVYPRANYVSPGAADVPLELKGDTLSCRVCLLELQGVPCPWNCVVCSWS